MSETERDACVDAAWKAASRDEPPAALDAAIQAAARQAVSAKPRRTRDKHWWYPLAAAATVAVIAVGLLQVTPPEQVAPTFDATQPLKQETAPVPAAPPPPAAAASTSPAISPAPAPSGTPTESAPVKKDLRPSEGKGASGPVQNAQRERAASDKLAQAAGRDTAANKPVQIQASPPAPVQASPPVEARTPEAFPAAQLPAAQSEVARRDAQAMAPRPNAASPASEPAATPSSAAPRSRDELPAAAAEEGKPQRQAMLAGNVAKMKTATPRSAEEWIKLIRDLRSEGRIDEASKELVAFRSAYGERADSLLPQDLREFEARTTAPAAK